MDMKPKYYANATRSADDCPSRVSEFKMTSFVFTYRTYVSPTENLYSDILFDFFSKFLGGMQPYGRAATAAIQWLSTASSRLKRTECGTEHSTSTWCQGSECMAPSSTPRYVLMTCSFISTGETWTCRFRLHGYVIPTCACGRWNGNCALQCLKAQA
jgi:hypothetical protein